MNTCLISCFWWNLSYSAGTLLWLLRKFVGCRKVAQWRCTNKKYENKVGQLYDWLIIIAIPARKQKLLQAREGIKWCARMITNSVARLPAWLLKRLSNDALTGCVRDFFPSTRFYGELITVVISALNHIEWKYVVQWRPLLMQYLNQWTLNGATCIKSFTKFFTKRCKQNLNWTPWRPWSFGI